VRRPEPSPLHTSASPVLSGLLTSRAPREVLRELRSGESPHRTIVFIIEHVTILNIYGSDGSWLTEDRCPAGDSLIDPSVRDAGRSFGCVPVPAGLDMVQKNGPRKKSRCSLLTMRKLLSSAHFLSREPDLE
jgi:hypothetical protein